MQLKYPGGALEISTGFWILLGVGGIWIAFYQVPIAWYVYAVIITASFALGIWFQIRAAGYAFIVVNIFLAAVGTLALVLKGPSTNLILKILGSIYCVVHCLEWLRNLREQNEERPYRNP